MESGGEPVKNITQLLQAIDQGDEDAPGELWQLVYDNLRSLAAHKMASEKPGMTLSATGLVHEAYLRLVPADETSGSMPFKNRRHFFGAAAEAMRRILIESVRQKKSLKRGGDQKLVEIDLSQVAITKAGDDLEVLNEALDRLTQTEPQVAELVKLRYFAGMTIPEAAELLEIAPRTADTWWAYARAWLLTELQREDN